MKTKFVKIPVSERLPENIIVFVNVTKEEIQAIETARTDVSTAAEAGDAEYYDYADGINKQIKSFFKKKKVLKTVPDHSEEMLSMLEDCLKSLEYVYKNARIKTTSEGYEDEIENILYRKQELEILINKVKDNG